MTPAEIRAARKALGLTQKQLAEVMGMRGQSTVSEWERSIEHPSPAAVRLIRLYLVLHSQAPKLLPDDWPTATP